METHIILVVASILLSGGCIGLAIVRLTNPFFKGAGWLGASFAAGALGAVAFAAVVARGEASLLMAADALILLAFVFLHVCFLELSESESRVPRLGIALLIVQALSCLFYLHVHELRLYSAVTLGLLMAVQAGESALLLKKTNQGWMDAPVWFNIALLLGFAVFNLIRSVIVLVVGTPTILEQPNPLQATSAVVFLGAAIGLGFGVFWMEGHQMRLDLEQLANIDPLTGIHNRRSFIALCEQELLKSSRTGDVFSLIMFDLDHFKQINDHYGHRTGDTVLCAVVEKLRNSVRNIDIVGRWGGEEFVALLPKADAEAAMIVAHRLRYHVDSIVVPSPRLRDTGVRHNITVTVSVGVTTYFGHDPTTTVQDLLHQCDSAMYQAKAEGRDRIISLDTQLMLVQ
ncbi:MAG TPA: GGDEF domain-containing protein [Acidobacteriaceae bacterium]|nr:GGDEF domain-containing protein [Acidobacteriaceae bacterium]